MRRFTTTIRVTYLLDDTWTGPSPGHEVRWAFDEALGQGLSDDVEVEVTYHGVEDLPEDDEPAP